ncbi:5'-nucleotidase C-terminal domain-containing protein [Streptococcus cuniculipharyngis]|uniref:Bifunctional metallophosphatase/5'-nucleotidase n=1 Tax=Streptococcus cuniculipharyngis TaxID=1562651 RepID=A0A5C5S9Y0_9STRE|nr:5'-nucleotidase C-terminal domain-containing protein [Streptococcus cuniculipharyngis]TWS96888.1 bifunctional metallophosphatase/5'-nucleotidase [Streptococcus cuniculipharyngis]
MDKKRMIPLLSSLVLSAAVLTNPAYAEEQVTESSPAPSTSASLVTEESSPQPELESSQSQDLLVPATTELETETETETDSSAVVAEPVSPTEESLAVSNRSVAPSESATVESEPAVSPVATAEASPLVTAPVTAESSVKDITILHTNDMHGNMEEGRGVLGMAKLATVVEESRKQGPTLLLDGGDALQGMPITNSTKGEEMVALMNQIGYDAMTVGNHEFDFGLDQLKRFQELLKFPIISSNIYVDGVRLLQPYTIIDKDKTVVGDEFVVIGLTTPEASTKTHPRNIPGVTFTEPIAEVEKVIAEVEARAQAEGKVYRNYVVLSHLGIDQTTLPQWQGGNLAKAFSQSKLLEGKRLIVVDGHSHTLATASYGDYVVYGQTGNYLNNVGKILVSADKMTASSLTYDDLKSVTPDPAVAAKVAQVKADFEQLNSEVLVANNPVELDADRMNVRVRETNIGNLITDAILTYGQTGFSHKTNLAVMNGGGIRKTLEKGKPITKGGTIAVLPFGNFISQIEMTGQSIYDMFVKSLGSVLQSKGETQAPVLDENGQPLLEPSGGFLHVAGAEVYYDTTLPAEERILAISIYNPETGAYEPIDLAKSYYLATNDFLAAGGDGYIMLGGAREEGPSLDTVFADFLQTQAKTLDWSLYEKINPNSRLISLSKASFEKLLEELAKAEQEDQKLDLPSTSENKELTLDQARPLVQAGTATGQATQAQTLVTTKMTSGRQTVAKPASFEVTKIASLANDKNHSLTSDKFLPLTAGNRSIMGIFAGLGLMILGLVGVRKKEE